MAKQGKPEIYFNIPSKQVGFFQVNIYHLWDQDYWCAIERCYKTSWGILINNKKKKKKVKLRNTKKALFFTKSSSRYDDERNKTKFQYKIRQTAIEAHGRKIIKPSFPDLAAASFLLFLKETPSSSFLDPIRSKQQTFLQENSKHKATIPNYQLIRNQLEKLHLHRPAATSALQTQPPLNLHPSKKISQNYHLSEEIVQQIRERIVTSRRKDSRIRVWRCDGERGPEIERAEKEMNTEKLKRFIQKER